MPLTLRAVEGWQLAHHGNRRQNAFCAMMSEQSQSCSGCLRMQQRICDGVNGVPCTLRCPFGINESAVGVKIGKEIIAYLQTGQVFFKAPNPRQTHRVLKLLKQYGLAVDHRKAARHYNETRVVQPDEYQATIRLLQFFADQLGALANQIQLQQKDSEPEQIKRARQYIEANCEEELSLADVAKQAGMSTFYFCKRFKKVTGVNFAHYVSCLRVEKAKNLLLNPNYRISEIAYRGRFSVPHPFQPDIQEHRRPVAHRIPGQQLIRRIEQPAGKFSKPEQLSAHRRTGARIGTEEERVFLVEDHPLMRRSITEAIERESDLTVSGHAEDAPAAQAEILLLQPDIVLTDIQLKSSSGLDLIKSLHAQLPALPIVATTMFAARQSERLARDAGATAFVHKADGPDQLIAAIRSVLKSDEREENS